MERFCQLLEQTPLLDELKGNTTPRKKRAKVRNSNPNRGGDFYRAIHSWFISLASHSTSDIPNRVTNQNISIAKLCGLIVLWLYALYHHPFS